MKKLISLENLLQTLTLLFALLLVSNSIRSSWFDVPLSVSGEEFGSFQLVPEAPECTRWFQAFTAILIIGLLASWLVSRTWTALSTTLATVGLVAVLCFPYFVMLKTPILSAESTWLQMQHDNLTWLGGDIYANAEIGKANWMTHVYLIDPPRQVKVVQLPSWSPEEFSLEKISDVLEWIGYTNVFCQFMRKGWPSAVVGVFLLLIITIIKAEQKMFSRIGLASSLFLALSTFALSLALIGPFSAKRWLDSAAHATAIGDFETSLEHLQNAESAFPVLSQDTYFIAQRGLLESRLEMDSEHARLFQAQKFEAAGNVGLAQQSFLTLEHSSNPAIRREALRAVLRRGIQDFNANRFKLAKQRFESVLQQQPANTKVVYYLQILALRNQNAHDMKKMVEWMFEITEHHNSKTTKVLRSVSQRNAMYAAMIAEEPYDIWLRSIEAKQ